MSEISLATGFCLLIIAAGSKFILGLKTCSDIADMIQERVQSEYTEHLCGSLIAAKTNLLDAEKVVTQLDPALAIIYQERTASLLNGLNDTQCQTNPIYLHRQAAGETPLGFPNTIYRLRWQKPRDSNG